MLDHTGRGGGVKADRLGRKMEEEGGSGKNNRQLNQKVPEREGEAGNAGEKISIS